MKALILSYFEPKGQGYGISMGAPCPHSFNFLKYFMILPQSLLFSKHQNKAEFDNLDDSEVLISDYFGHITSAASLASSASATSLASTTSTTLYVSSKNFLILMAGSYLAQKWLIMVLFCRMNQNPIFTDIWYSFCQRLLRQADFTFFENWSMKLKWSNLLNALGTTILLPLRAIYFRSLHYETPCNSE